MKEWTKKLGIWIGLLCFGPLALAEVGIFKGTFDPFHLGHRATMQAAQKEGKLKTVYVFPNFDTSHKKGVLPLSLRWEMLVLGVKDLPGISVIPLPVLRRAARTKDPMETLRSWIQKKQPGETLYSILGADSYLALPHPDVILKAKTPAQVLLVEREGAPLPPDLPLGVHPIRQPENSTSSTQIRSNVFHNAHLLPPAIAEFIYEHGLYDTVAHPDIPKSFRDLVFQEQARMVLDGGNPDLLVEDNNEQFKKYRPENRPVFPLKTYWVDGDKLEGFEADQIPSDIRRAFIRKKDGKTQYRLVVHPESRKFYRSLIRQAERGADFHGTPTASPRSMVLWNPGDPEEAFLVKVSLDKEVGKTIRTLGRRSTIRSIGANDLLAHNTKRLPENFHYFPEVLGLVPAGATTGGMIVRSLPRGMKRRGRLVPLFSLYGPTPKGAPPVLATMIRQSGLAPDAFIRQYITQPFLRLYLDLAIDHGISMEAHGQNVLIEIGKDGLPTGRFVFRDLGGFNIDLGYWAVRGHHIPDKLKKPTLGKDFEQAHTHYYSSVGLMYYFSGGFLYDLDRRLPGWVEKGWIPKGKVGRNQVETQFRRDVEAYLKEKAGVEARLGDDLDRLHIRVHAARRKLYGVVREDCRSALRALEAH